MVEGNKTNEVNILNRRVIADSVRNHLYQSFEIKLLHEVPIWMLRPNYIVITLVVR